MTALYPAILAWDDKTSILWALVVRGAASRAKLVTPALAIFCKPSWSNGFNIPTKVACGFIKANSALLGAFTFKTRSQDNACSCDTMLAPACWNISSTMLAEVPAPVATHT